MRKYIYIVVFVAGMSSLAVEMATERMMASTFGSGQEVWASIIGLILIYLTVGYFLGGRWADRSPNPATFFRILVWSAFLVGLVPLVARPVLRFTATAFDNLQLPTLFGSFASVLILLIAPITLMGMASPFAMRLLLTDSRQAGRTAGQISGVSTLGSFLGVFLPALVLIPLVGRFLTFMVIAGLLMGAALLSLWRVTGWRSAAVYLWMPLVLAVLAVFAMRGPEKDTPGMIYETESAHNYIQVLAQDDYRLLRLNEGQGIHSMYHPNILNYAGPWEQVLVGPFFNPAPYDPDQVRSMAIVGLAAGTTAYQATAVFGPEIEIDGFEIDEKIVEVAREYFAMTEPNLNVIVRDGRWGLAHSPKKYNIISIDAYRPPYIPWYMTTVEFFQITRDRLTEDGVLVINVGRGPNDRRLINTIGSTIAAVYPSVHVMDIPGTFNSIIYATVQPTDAANLDANFVYLNSLAAQPGQAEPAVHPLLLETMARTLANMQAPPAEGRILTDDRAPIEWITSSMILDFFLSGNAENMQ